jgi:hypothetical protein
MLANESLAFSHEPLATLGDTLALCRSTLSIGVSQAEDLPFGESNMDSLVLMEVDASGRRRATEFFALDRLGDAVMRLYERYAEILPKARRNAPPWRRASWPQRCRPTSTRSPPCSRPTSSSPTIAGSASERRAAPSATCAAFVRSST